MQQLILAQFKEITFQGLFLTHHHQDHCGGLSELSSKYPKPVFMHPLTAQLLKMSDFNPLLRAIQLLGKAIIIKDYVEIWHTPGHSSWSYLPYSSC